MLSSFLLHSAPPGLPQTGLGPMKGDSAILPTNQQFHCLLCPYILPVSLGNADSPRLILGWKESNAFSAD